MSNDGAWAKRSSGRGYNSNDCHSEFIGEVTGKITSFGVKTRGCSICDYWKGRGKTPPPHKCNSNHVGSSKSMEAALAAEQAKAFKDTGINLVELIADNDGSTYPKMLEVLPDLNKRRDKVHTRKNIKSGFYTLGKTHKPLQRPATINYLVRMIMYAIDQNHGNPDGIRSRLDQIIPHIYGEHKGCSPVWCKAENDPKFKLKHLPYKRPLTDKALRKDLEEYFEKLKAKADSLAFMGSTQSNESHNNTVCSKSPKARFLHVHSI